ncbi:hypothetical protein GUJ93_ZPchr0255g33282 [Zizania palustris]|uniref:Uncharacterized protein n=1 Tax=Zizania palustris TaxID=103762 RepID=A0A8J5R0V2_ZIZPA|nr:hypothetical protein GUJ93_ZPchr0255g33282 [Zizania palustris]
MDSLLANYASSDDEADETLRGSPVLSLPLRPPRLRRHIHLASAARFGASVLLAPVAQIRAGLLLRHPASQVLFLLSFIRKP